MSAAHAHVMVTWCINILKLDLIHILHEAESQYTSIMISIYCCSSRLKTYHYSGYCSTSHFLHNLGHSNKFLVTAHLKTYQFCNKVQTSSLGPWLLLAHDNQKPLMNHTYTLTTHQAAGTVASGKSNEALQSKIREKPGNKAYRLSVCLKALWSTMIAVPTYSEYFPCT